jgi:transcriptional regulator with XRE-family HTH domain
MSPDQCREARERLGWSRQKLADAAGVPVVVIADYEEEGLVTIADCLEAVRAALEAVGIGFPFLIDKGQFVPCGVNYSPPDKLEAH